MNSTRGRKAMFDSTNSETLPVSGDEVVAASVARFKRTRRIKTTLGYIVFIGRPDDKAANILITWAPRGEVDKLVQSVRRSTNDPTYVLLEFGWASQAALSEYMKPLDDYSSQGGAWFARTPEVLDFMKNAAGKLLH